MNDDQKTKEQLLEELARERERSAQAEERSLAFQEVSKRVAGAHDTDEAPDLIVNESAHLVGASCAFIRLLEEDFLVISGTGRQSVAGYHAEGALSRPAISVGNQDVVMARAVFGKTPIVVEDAAKDLSIEEVRLRSQKYGFHGFAAIPLLANDRSIGVLNVMDTRICRFTDDEISLLEAFADQAALALEKARLLNEAEREKERSDALYQISNRLAGAHDMDELLDLIVNEAARLVGLPFAYIRLLEGDFLVPRAATKLAAEFGAAVDGAGPGLKVGDGLMGRVMATKASIVTEDAAGDERADPERRILMESLGIHGGAAVPLSANDQSIGVLGVMDARVRRFTDDGVSLLTAFADQASLAFEKVRLLSEAEPERERAETEKERSDGLYRVSNLLAGAHDTDEVLNLIVNEANRLLRASSCHIRLLEGDTLVLRAATSTAKDYLAGAPPSLKVEEGTSLEGHVMATKKPLSGNAAARVLHPNAIRAMAERGRDLAAVASVPLLANDKSIGALMVEDEAPGRRFSEDEVSLLTAFAGQAALALDKSRLLSEAEARERQATQLDEVTTQLASNHDLDSVLDLITQQAAELMGGRSGAIFRFDEDRGGLVVTAMYNLIPEMRDMIARPGEVNAGRAYQERSAAWTNNLFSGFRYSDAKAQDIAEVQTMGWGQVGVLAAPIVIQDEVYGVLETVFDQHREFTDEDINLIQNLADSAAVAINNARFIEETQHAREDAAKPTAPRASSWPT